MHYQHKKVRGLAATLAAASLTAALAGCSLGGAADGASETGSGGTDQQEVNVVTHDSFSLPDELIAKFEKESGYKLIFSAPGDAGALVNQLILTKDSPLGDVVYGVDNTFAGRAIDNDVFAPYSSAELPASAKEYTGDVGEALTPIDMGDVCLNIDNGYFAKKNLKAPTSLDDLTKPEYRGLTVVTNPATSSPGLAFMLATVSAYGQDGWLDYWQQLADNGLKVDSSWSDAYSVDFSGSSGNGSYPIVLSYSTSPAFEVDEEAAKDPATKAPTSSLLDTCFRQVEYAGVLAGAENEEGAKAFIDFLLSDEVQKAIPTSMYMYPVNDKIELPKAWTRFAPLAEKPFNLDVPTINSNRDQWIKDWSEVVIG